MSTPIIAALPLYVPIPEACRQTGVSRKVIARLWKAGQVGHVPYHPQRHAIDLIQLRRWLAGHEAEKTKRGHHRGIRRDESNNPRPGVIYAICDHAGRVRYIGKAHDFKLRRRQHQHELLTHKHRNPHLQRWWDKMMREGRRPQFKILQECPPGTVDKCERDWIAKGQASGWKLCNLMDGGGLAGHGPESRTKLSEISRAKWADPEYVRRWEESHARKLGMSVDEWRERRRREQERRANRPPREIGKGKQEQSHRVAMVELLKTLTPLTYKGAAFVPLTQGKWARIDVGDWERVGRRRWTAQRKRGHWRAKWSHGSDGRCTLLSRYVMEAKDHEEVKNLSGDTLDCTRRNLRKQATLWR